MVLLLVLTSITLITLDRRESGAIGSVKSWARDLKAPIEDVIANVTDPVADWFDGVTHAGSLRNENERLRKQLADARGAQARSRNALRENDRLAKLLDLGFTADIPGVAARVVDGAPSNFENTIVIGVGRNDAAKVGMPVVSSDGLVGRVIDVSRRRATVLLLTDRTFGVGVRLEKTGEPGVSSGIAGQDVLALDFIDPRTTVARKELLVTSGLEGGRFPPGIPVGTVVSVAKRPGDLQQTIRIRPFVDLDRLEFVKVLLWPLAVGN